MHKRVHTGEKPYKCHICDYSATQLQAVKIHMKVHEKQTEEARFKCGTCGFQASSLYHLIRHKVEHTVYKCDLCDYKTRISIKSREP